MKKCVIYPLIFMIIFVVCLFTFFTAGCKDESAPGYEPVFGPPPAPSPLVVSRYAEAGEGRGSRPVSQSIQALGCEEKLTPAIEPGATDLEVALVGLWVVGDPLGRQIAVVVQPKPERS